MKKFATYLIAMLSTVATAEQIAATSDQASTNWAENIVYSSTGTASPGNEEELLSLFRSNSTLRVVGTRHTFNDISDTNGLHVSLEKFNSITVSPDKTQVTFGAGVTYSDLIKVLAEHKLALAILPSLPHVNVVGSLVTGTHGGGVEMPALITYAEAYRYLSPTGKM